MEMASRWHAVRSAPPHMYSAGLCLGGVAGAAVRAVAAHPSAKERSVPPAVRTWRKMLSAVTDTDGDGAQSQVNGARLWPLCPVVMAM